MIFKPQRSVGILVGIAMILSLLALDALLLLYLMRSQVNLAFFIFALFVTVSLPLLALLSYLVYALASLRYHVHRDALTIVWGATRRVVPMGSIQKVMRGADVSQDIKVRGVSWPGHLVGCGQLEEIGRTLIYASEPLAKQLLVITPTVAYGISPANLDGFLDAFDIRQHIGPIRLVSFEQRQPGFVSWPVWRDRLAHLLLGLGLVVNLILFAYLCWLYPALGRTELLKLPAIGLATWIVNSSFGILIHQRQQTGAYLLWGGAFVVQLICWLAVFSLIG